LNSRSAKTPGTIRWKLHRQCLRPHSYMTQCEQHGTDKGTGFHRRNTFSVNASPYGNVSGENQSVALVDNTFGPPAWPDLWLKLAFSLLRDFPPISDIRPQPECRDVFFSALDCSSGVLCDVQIFFWKLHRFCSYK